MLFVLLYHYVLDDKILYVFIISIDVNLLVKSYDKSLLLDKKEEK